MHGSFSNIGPTQQTTTTVKEVERIVGAVTDSSHVEDKLDLLVAAVKDLRMTVNVDVDPTPISIAQSPITITPDTRPDIKIEIPEIRVPQPVVIVKQDRWLMVGALVVLLIDIALKVIYN